MNKNLLTGMKALVILVFVLVLAGSIPEPVQAGYGCWYPNTVQGEPFWDQCHDGDVCVLQVYENSSGVFASGSCRPEDEVNPGQLVIVPFSP